MAAAFALSTALLLAPTAARAEEVVRIAVAEHLATAEVRGPNLRARPLTEEGTYAALERGSVRIASRGGQLILDGRSLEATAVKLRADGPIEVAGKRLRGAVELSIEPGGLRVVNELAMEDYLAAVLGSEMPPSFPDEALRAQAVAARTYALRKKIEAQGKPYHLGSTVLAQVYGGVHREDPRTKRAVEATSGEVLVFDHEPIEAYFFSSCGGTTEGGGEALGRPLPYLTSTSCDEPPTTPGARWSLALSAAEIGKRLGAGPLDRVEVTSRSATGRARTLRLVGAGRTCSMSAVEFRRRLGYGELKSLSFDVKRESGKRGAVSFRLTGRGSGHGAGLCQWGARAAAERGAGHAAILARYYPGAEIRRIY